MPPPVRQNRCLSRASSSRGWNGARQKSSKRSSRSSRSPSWVPRDQQEQRLERAGRACAAARHRAKAPSGSASAQMMAPAQPSSGSARLDRGLVGHGLPRVAAQVEGLGQLRWGGIGEEEEWFHRDRERWLPVRQVAVELELGDLGLVVDPLGPLVAQEPLEDVLAQALGAPARSSPSRRAPRDSDCGSDRMPSAARSSAVSSNDVGRRLGRQLVALVDAPQAGGQHHREGEVRVARRIGRPVLDAGRRLLAASW